MHVYKSTKVYMKLCVFTQLQGHLFMNSIDTSEPPVKMRWLPLAT